MENSMEHLFAYGTLMCDDIMREVGGYETPSTPALLKGFRRCRVKNESYPGIVPDASGSVAGIVYMNLPESSWKRLDSFEGEMYSRELAQIELADGSTLTANTFVVKPEFYDRLERAEWSFSEFIKTGKTAFLQSYQGFRKAFDGS
jgi:gamma-glutamylcyclotransferase (GGCT)/AIG2-like uncharacterized protein YtfP